MAKKGSKRKGAVSRQARERGLGALASPLDPEGWMAERPDYWLNLPAPERPTVLARLRTRALDAAILFGLWRPNPWERFGADDGAWRRLSESALGPLPPAPGGRKRPTSARVARGAARPGSEPDAGQAAGPRAALG